MTAPVQQLEISTAPFLHRGLNTPRLMWEVVLTLVPVMAAATWWFGISAPLVVAAAVSGAMLVEWGFGGGARTLRDGSALLTGILLALTLPPSIPLWMAALGGAVGMGLGKVAWGGLGQNLFNPDLVGRAFLQAAFPTTMTTWTSQARDWLSIEPSTLAPPLLRADVDVITVATPLGKAKFRGESTELVDLMLGSIDGSLGETSALLLVLCGLWLAARRVFDWRLPVSTLLSVAVASAALNAVAPERFQGAPFMLLSGGLLFGAVYMVTDPVTTPLTPRGAWIFGAGVGLLVVLIRNFGGLPEGVMYAILLMNAVTPLINRATQPRRFGG
jgi:electron transport complex protein RnfD